MTEKTAVIYARVSDRKQKEEELPIASQLEECRRKAEQLGASVLRIFADEGRSGRTSDRPAFQDAILYCETYSPIYLITWSSSRFARNRVDAGFYKQRLDRAGTSLCYVSMEVDTSTDSGWMQDAVMEIFDELHSRRISADTRRSLLKNAREGRWNGGRPPFGFRVVPDPQQPKRKRLEPDPAEALLVRKIFELRARDGMGARQLTHWLNEQGHSNRGKRWNKTVVGYLLRNQAMIGRTVFGKTDRATGRQRPRDQWIVVESHQAIVPMDLWEEVQAGLDAAADACESGSPNSQHLFTGLLHCGECGARLHIETAKGRSRRYFYYNCSAAMKLRRHAPRRLPADVMDDYLVDVICAKVFSFENLHDVVEGLRQAAQDWAVDRNERRRSIVARLTGIEGKVTRLYEVLELYGKDAPNLADLTHRLRQHNEERKLLEQQLAQVEAEQQPAVRVTEEDVRQLATALVDIIKTSERPARIRTFFSSFIEGVTIEDEQVVIQYDPSRLVTMTPQKEVMVPRTVMWLPGTGSNRRPSD